MDFSARSTRRGVRVADIVSRLRAHEPPGDAAVVRIDPGLAFGTGSHPTTRLALQFLDQSVVGGERVLDYGCGSGILAIAAAKHHEAGTHEKAAHHAHVARGHALHARHHAEEAAKSRIEGSMKGLLR